MVQHSMRSITVLVLLSIVLALLTDVVDSRRSLRDNNLSDEVAIDERFEVYDDEQYDDAATFKVDPH